MHPPILAGAVRPFGISAAQRCPAQKWFDIMVSDIVVQQVRQLELEIAIIITSGATPQEYAEGDADVTRFVSLMKPNDKQSGTGVPARCGESAA
ncbi:hypothetical protein DSM110093_02326 [Sulfitobacter sp. DSM 110093]|uniref:hypothetical protein n=1 Tax=Sulfitobacter sp. DSM 110093 TaxID=2883127 RepID=UPI001FAB8AD0|nr:hypothetical protein [Sulfitobacter sp. DSM 110093]UOA32526.1 hypothetical protein DSM110093_02326 [Sulfitobacter sp. DSM 110093]